jgi:hypothetical protein
LALRGARGNGNFGSLFFLRGDDRMADAPKPHLEKKMPEKSILEQLKQLDQQRQKLLDGARDEALNTANAAIRDLNELGFRYRLVEGDEPATKRTGGKGKTRQKTEVCSICNFATEPPHDGRHKAHREQGDKKKPFTDKQLEEFGLTKKKAASA